MATAKKTRAKSTGSTNRKKAAGKTIAGVYVMIGVQKNSGNALHRHCTTLDAATEAAKEADVNWDYPVYVKDPAGTFHVINSPNQ